MKKTDWRQPCSVDGCEAIAISLRLCGSHYWRFRKYGDPLGGKHRTECESQGCERRHWAKGRCKSHYDYMRRGLDPDSPIRPRGNGGKGYLRKDGYRLVRSIGHPNGRTNGDILEHVLVMSQKLGRPLKNNERVHHINGVRDDNRPENLELWVVSQPSGQRVTDMLRFCREFLEEYESDVELWPDD